MAKCGFPGFLRVEKQGTQVRSRRIVQAGIHRRLVTCDCRSAWIPREEFLETQRLHWAWELGVCWIALA